MRATLYAWHYTINGWDKYIKRDQKIPIERLKIRLINVETTHI